MAEIYEMPVQGRFLFEVEAVPVEPPADAAPDWRERERALDVRGSWIVEAPAGSGKTGLLIQRYLKLLAEGEVDRPEQVLAVTFTNAATAEISERVMEELDGAAAGTEVTGAFARETRSLAEAVLRRDRAMGWGLRESPRRLKVRSIDSVCAEIARSLPVTSGGGAGATPVEEPGGLYREAARRTLLEMGGKDPLLTEAVRTLLLHRDGSIGECEQLLSEMLRHRDQWGELVPISGTRLTEKWLEEEMWPRLDRALELVVCAGLESLIEALPHGFLSRLTEVASELGERPGYQGKVSPLVVIRELRGDPDAAAKHLAHWRALIHLLVAPSSSTWRKSFNVNNVKFAATKEDKERLKELIETVEDNPEVLKALCSVSALPPARYPEEQWRVAKALFRVLSRALAELQLVFSERGECDFAEPALLARTALRQDHGAGQYESSLGMELRHLLVDEMQDTSTGQYELIAQLTKEWSGEGKTVFLVGDPKQSIYLFRQARVERFLRTMETGELGELRLGSLRLTANFRSQAGLVRGFNRDFAEVFPDGSGGVPFVTAKAVRGETEGVAGESGLEWHTEIAEGRQLEMEGVKRRNAKTNAMRIRNVAERWRARPLPPGRTDPWKIAVLVGSRRDLRQVAAALKREEAAGPVPFRAVKVEPLKDQREVLDLQALTRALLHPADRVAWWAVLRAPWCGLQLADLHVLAGEDDRAFRELTVKELIVKRGELLGVDGIARLERVWPVLEAAVERRSKLRIPELVERTWRSLGGDATLGETELANALRYLELLDEIDRDAGAVTLTELNIRLERLYAAPGIDRTAVDLMTIHGAKGLEWDVVMVPEMERKAPPSRSKLLEWEEVVSEDEDAAPVVLAPIEGKGDESEALNLWLKGIRRARERAERRRVFYVASTRAREELHLFGTADRLKDGTVKAQPGSLLEAAWPAVEERFTQKVEESSGVGKEEPEEVFAIAAAAVDSEDLRPAMLERIPASFDPLARFRRDAPGPISASEEVRVRFARPEGSFAARSFGNAVHTFLELAARRLAEGAEAKALAAEVMGWRSRIVAVLRGDGLAPTPVETLAGRVLMALMTTLRDPVGRWLLGSRVDARSEYALNSWVGGGDERWSRVRMDRIFRAGATPEAADADLLWIVDYKTGSHGAEGVDAFLEKERAKYAGQMEGYARASGEQEVRVGLWYPIVGRLMWWVVGRG